MAPKRINLHGLVTSNKAYQFIGFGDMHGIKAYEIIGFGDIHGTKAYKFILFGDIHHSVYNLQGLVTYMAPKHINV